MTGVFPSDAPFVLLDDARASGAAPARLYTRLIEIVSTNDPSDIAKLLPQLQLGNWAGFLAYEAGHALEPRLQQGGASADLPLMWFGRFDSYQSISADQMESLLPDPLGGWAGPPVPDLSQDQYCAVLDKVQAYITAGDIYQANLTFGCSVAVAGHPLAIYAGMRARAKAGYGGVVWTGKDWLISLSPELFFALQDRKITTKPMKGTAAKERDAVKDQQAIGTLRADPKQRAENLMIVDLLRNDLSRVADAGTVSVPQLFTVETYPTVHQMTSTVTAELREGSTVADILAAIFPCGSITGAPKIRAMEIISEVEQGPRGIYTGSIGRIDANGDAAFNVAIRTLHLRDGATSARLGLGGGIVADSRKGEEWAECKAKGRFVADQRRFDLIETMRFDPATGIALLERHLARLKASAATFGFVFDRHAARNELQAATFRITTPRRVRLLLSPTGKIAIEISALPKTPEGPVDVAPIALPVAPEDFRLRHKTTDRAFYDAARRAADCFEVALVDPQGLVTEGSFTTIFIKRGSILQTPRLDRGLLPGVLREELIEQGLAEEADLTVEDLRHGFFVGNATRGLLPAQLKAL